MPPGGQDLPRKLARYYDLPLQVSSFFALLILSEGITHESVECLGQVNACLLAHKLRRGLENKGIEVRSRRSAGYWLDDDTRRLLAKQFGVEIGIGI